jgi:hypothetical protein
MAERQFSHKLAEKRVDVGASTLEEKISRKNNKITVIEM